MRCRNCHEETGDNALVDLGSQPLANSLVNTKNTSEPVYPLRPVICKNGHCRLIQLPELPGGVGFGKDYPYRSGQSEAWKAHLESLAAAVLPRWDVACPPDTWVVEVGGNDGTLGEIVGAHGADYMNIDPSGPVDPWTRRWFMSRKKGETLGPVADYVFALNVAAHVPDLDDFFAGIHAILKPTGKLVVEVQDVNRLIETGAWDCIYHEHYSYFNAQTLCDAVERRGFFVSRIESIPTHGGSVRITATKHNSGTVPLRIPKPYPKWGEDPRVQRTIDLIQFNRWHDEGKRVVGYGAPAKASTWLNYMGLTSYGIKYIVDSTPEKIGKFTPGSHIEISSPRRLEAQCRLGKTPPDIVVILAWNWASEILPKVPIGPAVWCRGERLR